MSEKNTKEVSNIRVNQKTKSVYADVSKLTEEEKTMLTMYIAGGYVLRKKSKSITKADMVKYIKKYFEGEKADKYLEFVNDKTINFMKTKSIFKQTFPEYPDAPKTEEPKEKGKK